MRQLDINPQIDFFLYFLMLKHVRLNASMAVTVCVFMVLVSNGEGEGESM